MGTRRTFASALEWPGWSRSGRSEAAALEALANHAARYRAAIQRGRVNLPAGAELRLEVVERTTGDASTEFGVPGKAAASELEAPDAAGLDRLINLLGSCWSAFDAAVTAAPAELRKGPRGGGRDRDPIAEHVLAAESEYSRHLGLRLAAPAYRDQPSLTAFREAIIAGIRTSAAGWKPGAKGWPARYAVRRIAWHALDHAWEIEDRSSG